MIKITTYTDLNSNEKSEFFNFLKLASTETQLPAHSNMWDDNWINQNNTLPYVLECTDRFKDDNGQFHIIFSDDEIVACGGVYKSDFNKSVALAGTRTWVKKEYRNHSLLREYMLPIHKSWSIAQGCKIVALCFNDYNKNLIKVFKRARLGENSDRISNRNEQHLFYSGVQELDFPVIIQYTPQWVIYERLYDWDFDWINIKY